MDVTVYQTKKSDVRLHGAYCTSLSNEPGPT